MRTTQQQQSSRRQQEEVETVEGQRGEDPWKIGHCLGTDPPKGVYWAFFEQASSQQEQKHHVNIPGKHSHFCACAEARSLSAWLRKCILVSNIKSFEMQSNKLNSHGVRPLVM